MNCFPKSKWPRNSAIILIGILVGKAINFANSASGLRLRFKYQLVHQIKQPILVIKTSFSIKISHIFVYMFWLSNKNPVWADQNRQQIMWKHFRIRKFRIGFLIWWRSYKILNAFSQLWTIIFWFHVKKYIFVLVYNNKIINFLLQALDQILGLESLPRPRQLTNNFPCPGVPFSLNNAERNM